MKLNERKKEDKFGNKRRRKNAIRGKCRQNLVFRRGKYLNMRGGCYKFKVNIWGLFILGNTSTVNSKFKIKSVLYIHIIV